MLRKANDALFGVNITREFGLRALFCGKHSEAGGWIEHEQAFANAYSFLAVIDCRSHFSRTCAFSA